MNNYNPCCPTIPSCPTNPPSFPCPPNSLVQPLKVWASQIIPCVYDDSLSYYELLERVICKLNEVICAQNKIPEIILDQFKWLIENGVFAQLVNSEIYKNIYSVFVNVKYPPSTLKRAIGDGVTDDTDAFQQAIDYASKYRGIVLVPDGIFKVSGVVLKDFTYITGINNSKSILLADPTKDMPIFTAGDFDTNATGSSSTVVGCQDVTITNLQFDGNYSRKPYNNNCVEYYGISLTIKDCIFKNASKYNLICEAPGNVWNLGKNIQYKFDNIVLFDGLIGNMYYNGQSDSNLINILSYYHTDALLNSNQFNVRIGSKANGTRITNCHFWGVAKYSCINEANNSQFENVHLESATIAKLYLKASTIFIGRIYEFTNANYSNTPGVLIDPGILGIHIKASFVNLKTAIQFVTGDSGNSVYEFTMYSNVSGAQLCNTNFNANTFVKARGYGTGWNDVIEQSYNYKFDSTRLAFYGNSHPISFYPSTSKTTPSFSVEVVENPSNYISVAASQTDSTPIIYSRGGDQDIDILLAPKNEGRVRFGAAILNSNVRTTGYIEIKDSSGFIRRLAIVEEVTE